MADENQKADFTYSALWELSVPELEKLLYSGSCLPSDDASDEFYDAVEAALLQKEKEHPSGRLPDIEKAWAGFQTDYQNLSDHISRYAPPNEKSTQKAIPRERRTHKAFRCLASMAAVLAAVILSFLVVQASGVDVLGAIARWTADTFHFESTSGYTESSNPVMHLQEAMELLGIPEFLSPTGIPDHYQVEGISTSENVDFRLLSCVIMGLEQSGVSVTIVQRLSQNAQEFDQYEKDAAEVVEYPAGDFTFYLFSNHSTSTAMWSDGQYSISIVGDITVHDMQQILNVLYGGN